VDAVEDGGTGILVPPSDSRALRAAAARLLVDPALCEKQGNAARLRLGAARTSADILAVYEAAGVLAG
jgi:hypothetical protein